MVKPRRIALMIGGMCGIGCVCWGIYCLLSLPASLPLPQPSPQIIRIGSANLNYKNTHKDAVTTTLIKSQSDILVLLEWTGSNLNLSVFENHGWKIILNNPRPGTHGSCILAKHTLKIQARLMPSPVHGPCRIPLSIARYEFMKQYFTLIGVHAPPSIPACKQTTTPTILAIATWIKDGNLITPLEPGHQGDKVVIVGDLNVVPWSSSLHALSLSGVYDAYRETQWRPGPTWFPWGLLPAIVRIDYIFAAQALTAQHTWVIPLPGSDHRGIIADMSI